MAARSEFKQGELIKAYYPHFLDSEFYNEIEGEIVGRSEHGEGNWVIKVYYPQQTYFKILTLNYRCIESLEHTE